MKTRTDRWHNTGGNGPATQVWVRKLHGKSVVIAVHKYNVVVDHWEKQGPALAFNNGGYVRTMTGGFWQDLASAKLAADAWLGVTPRKSRAGLKRYSVVGFYRDNRQPFVSWETATDPKAAAETAIERRSNVGVRVVEVFHGHVRGILENNEVL